MRELIHDPFYEQIKTYERCAINYCLLEDDCPHQGKRSHWNAVLQAMLNMNEWTIDMGKAEAHPVDAAAFLYVPEIKSVGYYGKKYYDIEHPECEGGQIPYWYAFLEPPHGTGPVIINGKMIRKEYAPEDFEIVNRALFPQGTNELEVYEWTTDWSDYFDAGHEWWGAACWSVYDKTLNRYAVIMASATD